MTKQPTIFFALSSEGMGHATRCAPVIVALRERGYRVEVFCGGRVAEYLRKRTGPVTEHFFIKLIYENNQLSMWKSFTDAFSRVVPMLGEAVRLLVRLLRERPVAVVSDFEFMLAWLGWWTRTPVIACDNMHVLPHGQMPKPQTAEDKKDEAAVNRSIWWSMPVVDRVLITSFYQPPLKNDVDAAKVRYVPCVARPEVLRRAGRTTSSGPILVYQTSSTNLDLPGTLALAADQGQLDFVVYGMGRTGSEAGGHVVYKPFSEDEFLDDLAAAPFVIVNGGHSTIVEALALGKPVLCEPIRRQYEQKANAIGLAELGVGRGVDKMDDTAILDFARQAPVMRARAARLSATVVDNEVLFDALEQAIYELNPARALPPRGSVSFDGAAAFAAE